MAISPTPKQAKKRPTKSKKKTAKKGAKRKSSASGFIKKHSSRLKVAAEILTLVVAAEKLIELTVQFWRSLPFGPAPGMPPEYNYLASEVPFSWPLRFDTYTPTNKGPNSIDWSLAKKIYLDAQSIKEKAESGTSPDLLQSALSALEADKTRLVETVQPGLREMLRDQIASKSTGLGLKPAG